ncbi:MAG: hypothetical protein WC280_02010 [Patescibacteria group bacterium]
MELEKEIITARCMEYLVELDPNLTLLQVINRCGFSYCNDSVMTGKVKIPILENKGLPCLRPMACLNFGHGLNSLEVSIRMKTLGLKPATKMEGFFFAYQNQKVYRKNPLIVLGDDDDLVLCLSFEDSMAGYVFEVKKMDPESKYLKHCLFLAVLE